MAGRRGQRVQVVLAIALVLGGAWLLYVGVSYVSAWLTYEAQRATALNPGPTCSLCNRIVTRFVLMPSPWSVSVSYLVAIPAILGIAWWTHRGSQLRRPAGATVARLQRAGSDILVGAMGWMVFMFALAIMWPGAPFVAPVSGPPIPWSMFFISILVVPAIVVGVGVAFLWDSSRRRSRAPSRAVRG